MRVYFFLCFILSSVLLSAQTEQCGTMYADSILRSKIPGAPSLIDFEEWLQLKMNEPSNVANQRGAIVTIPVIVHVIHDGDAVGSGQNISEAQVLSQIDVLNEDFRRLNADAVNTPATFLPVAADIEIEFCPAVVDPNGMLLAEPGIHRVHAGQATWASSADIDINLKPSTIWDPTRYFNIWTVDFGSGSTLLGYAQFPEGSGLAGMPTGAQSANTDGIVCRYNAFGRVGNVNSPYDLGRTATHEAGHWLGLRHIWGDGDCSVDDYCTDTPESDASNNGCQTGYVSCGNVNMVQNYMDYSNDACMNIFTSCQKTRMRTVLQNSPRRVELLNSTVCELLNQVDVTGQVRDAQTTLGMPFAKVRFKNASYNYEADCDVNGNFAIDDMFVGTYNVYGGKWSYVTAELIVTVQSGMSPVVISVSKGYYDDFVLDFSWGISGTATSGEWVRAQPVGTTFNGVASNPGADVTNDLGTECFTTGNGGGAAGNDDVDNGTTIITSPVFDLTTYSEPYINFYRWFYNDGGTGTPNDNLVVRITNGVTTATIETLVYNTPNSNQWNFRNARIEDYVTLTANMRFIVETGDLSASGHIVEAGLDFFRVIDSLDSPQAAFSVDVSQGCAPLTVHFTDASTGNPTAWQWSFPGGTPNTSAAQNPIIIYNTPGIYNVTLTVTNAAGNDAATQNAFITADEIRADFSPDVQQGCPGLVVEYSDFTSCSPTTWQWSFPGGTPSTSSQKNPVVTYYTSGVHVTTLIVGNASGNDTLMINNLITILEKPFATIATVNTKCFGSSDGEIVVTVSQGTPPYSALWSDGQTGLSRNNLSVGNYSATITDQNGCKDTTAIVAITQPAELLLSVSSTPDYCGTNSGTAEITTNGGTPLYIIEWNTGASASAISNLASGQYSVTVTDANSCQKIESVSVATNNNTPIVVLTEEDLSCNGLSDGTIISSVSGGTAPYSYEWSNGADSASVSNLPAGSYSLTATDVNGCSTSQLAIIEQPDAISVSDSVTDASCGLSNGAISLSVSGGEIPYSYLWRTGDTSDNLLNVAAGNYALTVTDNNNCEAQNTFTVNTTGGPDFQMTTSDALCYGQNGSITVSIISGTPPYTYNWSTGDTGQILTASAGTYSVSVADSSGCVSIGDTSFSEHSELQLAVQVADVVCSDKVGLATASANGGTPPYTFLWNNQISGDSVFLGDGMNEVTITDANGCTATDSVLVLALPEPHYALQSAPDSANQNTGAATVTITTGVSPFSYLWSDALAQTDSVATGLSAGLYFVTITDGNGCEVVDSVLVEAFVSASFPTEHSISLYPNPNNGIFRIETQSDFSSLHVEGYNALGEKIFLLQNLADSPSIIDLRNYGKGVYCIRIFIDEKVITLRVIYASE
ncbi:MAG: M43 family zinc metalloprotease [Chitinophagales bacterium]|nr:M43 family zinc metalloprotease [Chitinophagales bacterium]